MAGLDALSDARRAQRRDGPTGAGAGQGDRSRGAYAALLTLSAVDAAGYSVIAPVLPEIAAATGAGPTVIGALVALFPAGMILGFVAAGGAVRRQRLAALALAALALMGLGALGFVLGDGLPVYAAARFVGGTGSGCLWLSIVFSTLERWPRQAYHCMSRVFAGYSVGGLIGPALGGLGGVRSPFAAYLVLVVAGAAAVTALVPRSRRQRFHPDRAALRLPAFRLAAAGILFAVLVLGVIEGVLPLHLSTALSQGQIGLLYAAMSAVVAAAAAAAGRYPPLAMLAAGTVLACVGLALTGAATAVALWIPGLAVAGAGVGIANTKSIGVLLDAVDTERIVTAMVVWSQLGIAGYLVGPVVSGPVVQHLGFAALGIVPATAALAVGAAWLMTTAKDG
ncbi:hypothetical protein BH23ACT7_BH23ACT7_23290 [soil metagenome]